MYSGALWAKVHKRYFGTDGICATSSSTLGSRRNEHAFVGARWDEALSESAVSVVGRRMPNGFTFAKEEEEEASSDVSFFTKSSRPFSIFFVAVDAADDVAMVLLTSCASVSSVLNSTSVGGDMVDRSNACSSD